VTQEVTEEEEKKIGAKKKYSGEVQNREEGEEDVGGKKRGQSRRSRGSSLVEGRKRKKITERGLEGGKGKTRG